MREGRSSLGNQSQHVMLAFPSGIQDCNITAELYLPLYYCNEALFVKFGQRHEIGWLHQGFRLFYFQPEKGHFLQNAVWFCNSKDPFCPENPHNLLGQFFLTVSPLTTIITHFWKSFTISCAKHCARASQTPIPFPPPHLLRVHSTEVEYRKSFTINGTKHACMRGATATCSINKTL